MKIFYGTIIALSVFSCNSVDKNAYAPLKIKGSESLHESFDALASDFEKQQDTLKVILEGGGSRTGLQAIKDKSADIGLSSFSFDLTEEFGVGHEVIDRVVASDGIVVVNNENNPIKKLTKQQISDIYNGNVKDWSELGGNPGLIVPIARDSNSGTQRFFESYFDIADLTSSVKVAKENNEIVNSVYENSNEIGFIGFAYFNMLVKEVAISAESDSTFFIEPTPTNVKKGIYPLNRSLHIYYQKEGDDRLKAFLKYLGSERAQKIIESTGLIPNQEPFVATLVD